MTKLKRQSIAFQQMVSSGKNDETERIFTSVTTQKNDLQMDFAFICDVVADNNKFSVERTKKLEDSILKFVMVAADMSYTNANEDLCKSAQDKIDLLANQLLTQIKKWRFIVYK